MAGKGGAMNKANARQNLHRKEKYKRQAIRGELNKAMKIEKQKKFEERKTAEKKARVVNNADTSEE